MAKLQQREVLCQVCKEQKKMSEVFSAEVVREPIVEKIMATHPDWSSQGFICKADLNRYRAEFGRSGRATRNPIPCIRALHS